MIETSTGEEAVTTAIPTLDLPEDARCATCGYLLRGLAERRCPECGSVFDPSTIRDTFVPRWPELLSWWVAASVLPVVVVVGLLMPEMVRSYRYLAGEAFAIRVYFWCAVADLIGKCLLGPLVLLGLWWRQDWARRLCAAGLFMLALMWVFNLGVQVVSHIRGTWPKGDALGQAIDGVLGNAVPAVLLAVYLMTGLCRCSLQHGDSDARPRLAFREFHPRQDWLLLTLILVAAMGLPFAGKLVNLVARHLSLAGVYSLAEPSQLAWWVLDTVVVAGCAATIAMGWRRPRTLRRNLALLVGMCVVLKGLQLAWFISRAGRSLTSWPLLIGTCLYYHIGPLFPPLALLLFLFVRLNRTDITQVSYNGHVVAGDQKSMRRDQ